MKIRPGYGLRKVLDVYVVVGTGMEAYDPYRVMSVNETGAFLWKLLEAGAELETLAERLAAEYDVSPEAAERDTKAFLAMLREKGLAEG